MKKVYYQLVDPINRTSSMGDRLYADNCNEIEAILRELHINSDDYIQCASCTRPNNTVPNMPDYYIVQGYIDGTSKLFTAIVITE